MKHFSLIAALLALSLTACGEKPATQPVETPQLLSRLHQLLSHLRQLLNRLHQLLNRLHQLLTLLVLLLMLQNNAMNK